MFPVPMVHNMQDWYIIILITQDKSSSKQNDHVNELYHFRNYICVQIETKTTPTNHTFPLFLPMLHYKWMHLIPPEVCLHNGFQMSLKTLCQIFFKQQIKSHDITVRFRAVSSV